MKRRQFIKNMGTCSATMLFAPQLLRTKTVEKPNFIYILVDDLGYGDVNLNIDGLDVFKNPYVKTPNLARLAKQSKVFTHHYAASPVCSPSRAGLLTGRTPTRCNINLWINDRDDNDKMFLSGKEITIPEQLKAANYESAIIGKWHLNGADWNKKENWIGWTGSFPKQQGFDYAFVSKENPHETTKLWHNSQENPGDFFDGDGNSLGTVEGFSSQIITDKAIDWIRNKRNSEKPFFLYLPYDAVHEKVMNPVEYNNMYNTGDYKKDKYYANITYLDAQIGRLLDYLDTHRLTENTVVFFSSDNGPEILDVYWGAIRSYGTSAPLNGQKRQLLEGGIRVPGMVRWPGKIEPGVSTLPNSTLDVMPTLCNLAGINAPKDRAIDGASLVPHLLENKEDIKREKPLYWQFEPPWNQNWEMTGVGYDKRYDGTKGVFLPLPVVVIRSGEYVLRGYTKDGKVDQFRKPVVFQLYDVANDPEERVELSKFKPNIFKKMKSDLLAIWEDVDKDRRKTMDEIKRKIDQRK